jgi:hypothetical protein
MKIGIKKIENISATKIKNWGYLPRNTTTNLLPLITGPFSEILFTGETASLEEEWIESPAGLYSQVTVNGSVRLKAKEMQTVLPMVMSSENIYRVTTLENERLIIGSLDFKPRLTFKRAISWITTSEFVFTITCKSLHGLIRETEL